MTEEIGRKKSKIIIQVKNKILRSRGVVQGGVDCLRTARTVGQVTRDRCADALQKGVKRSLEAHLHRMMPFLRTFLSTYLSQSMPSQPF